MASVKIWTEAKEGSIASAHNWTEAIEPSGQAILFMAFSNNYNYYFTYFSFCLD